MRFRVTASSGWRKVFAGLVVRASRQGLLKDSVRLGELRQVGIVQFLGFLFAEHKAVLGQLDGRRHHRLQPEFAVRLLRISQTGNRAGNGDRLIAERARSGNHVAVRIQIHVARSSAWRLFTVVDEQIALAVVRLGQMHQHEPAAADIARDRVHHGEREAGSDRRIHRVAALLQNGYRRRRWHRDAR